MREFFFHNWQKPVSVFVTGVVLAGLIIQPVAAADSTKSWFTAQATKVTEKVCPKQRLTLQYQLIFQGLDYEKDMNRQNKPPIPSLKHPEIKITSNQGKVENVKSLEDTYKYSDPYDSVFKFWSDIFDFIPDKPGTATVTIKATYLGVEATDKWEIKVWETCKFDIEINADQSGARMPSGQTFNEAQKDWSFIIWLKGKAKGVLADPLVNEGGSGGNQRLIMSLPPVFHQQEDVTGTEEFFGDGIFIGHEEFTCGTKGALTCNHEFTVHAVPGEETINFQINNESGQCSSFTVWCEGEGGHGEITIPPLSSLAFQMNAEIPWEGGSTHFIHQLPHGVTLDYLISAFPEVEE
jgi:hypothetical protein